MLSKSVLIVMTVAVVLLGDVGRADPGLPESRVNCKEGYESCPPGQKVLCCPSGYHLCHRGERCFWFVTQLKDPNDTNIVSPTAG